MNFNGSRTTEFDQDLQRVTMKNGARLCIFHGELIGKPSVVHEKLLTCMRYLVEGFRHSDKAKHIICDIKFSQLLAAGWWFSPGIPGSPTSDTDIFITIISSLYICDPG